MTSDWKKSDSLALSFRAKREIFVIRGQTNHVRKAQTGNLISWKPLGIASYILRRPALPIDLIEPAEPLSHAIKGALPHGLTLNPEP